MSPPHDPAEAWRRLAAAGHDLRQPVHALGLYLAVLARKSPDAELGPRLAAALDEVRESMDLALDFAKLQAGAWKPRLREFPLAELFGPLRERLAAQAGVREVELRFVGGSLSGRGDPDLLRRALGELAGPAVRARRGGRLLVGARRRGGEILVQVRELGRSQGDRADELAHLLAAGLATLAGGAVREQDGRLDLAFQAA